MSDQSCDACHYRELLDDIEQAAGNMKIRSVEYAASSPPYELERLSIAVAELHALLQRIVDRAEGKAEADLKYKAAMDAAYERYSR